MQRGFPSDPVKAWKDLQKKGPEEDLDDDTSSEASSASSSGGPDFGYLLSMSLLSLSREKKEELLKERDNKVSSKHDQVQVTSRIALSQINADLNKRHKVFPQPLSSPPPLPHRYLHNHLWTGIQTMKVINCPPHTTPQRDVNSNLFDTKF